LPFTGSFELNTLNTSLTELSLIRPGRWRLLRYNDAAHLEGLAESDRAG
jgi:probable phosphoglycerate mutase